MFTEDLSTFFDASSGFAQQATLDGAAVEVIFDDSYAQSMVGIAGMATSRPSVLVRSTAVAADPVGLPLVVGADQYVIAEHHPDGTGVSVLVLELSV
jgi:hypothetical protein